MGKSAKLEENNKPLAWVVISEDGVERPTCITEAQAIAVANNLKYHREALKIVPLYANPPVIAENTTSRVKSVKPQVEIYLDDNEDRYDTEIEFYIDPSHVFSVSIDPSGNITWAYLWGDITNSIDADIASGINDCGSGKLFVRENN